MIVKRLLSGGQRVGDDGGGTIPERFFCNGAGLTDVTVMTAVDALTGVAVPAHNSTHPDDGLSNYKARTIEADLVGTNPLGPMYMVDVGYRAAQFQGGTGGEPGAPTFGYEWDTRIESVSTNADLDGHPIVNAAGDPFDGAFEAGETVVILRVYATEVFDPTKMALIVNAVNSVDMTVLGRGILARQMICRAFKPSKRLTRGQESAATDVEYLFEIRKGHHPWDHHALNAGFRGFYNDTADEQETTTPRKAELYGIGATDAVGEAVLLAADGRPVNADAYQVGNDRAAPVPNPEVAAITRAEGEAENGGAGWMEFRSVGAGNYVAYEAVARKCGAVDFTDVLSDYFGEVTPPPPDDGVDP